MEMVNVRNLEQINEQEGRSRSTRLGTLVLSSIAGAALVMVAVMMVKQGEAKSQSSADPLAALVASAKAESAPADELDTKNASFPSLLSDADSPTTALAAVQDSRGRLVGHPDEHLPRPPGAPTSPPPPSDRLPVVPLPAGTLLSATPVTTEPKDDLTRLALSGAGVESNTELAPEGSDQGYQIQVASFKEQADADRFAEDLRRRGHQAFRQAAYVADRGLWHRVRVGPFKSKFLAQQYKKKFEKSERLSPFVVDPQEQKRAEELLEARRDARLRRFGSDH